MKKTFSRCASLSLAALALFLAPSARSQQTPVLFPLVNLTGTANNRTIYITPDAAQNPLWYGTNLVSLLPFPIYPIGGQVITNLTPWGYTFRVDGWPRGIHVVVPFSTNTLNIVSLINTNQFAPLQILALANNATGTNVNLSGVFNGVAAGQSVTNNQVVAAFGGVTLTNQGATLNLPNPFVFNQSGTAILNIWTNQDVFFGFQAGALDAPPAAPVPWDLNTGIGAYALNFNSAGLANTAIGSFALQQNRSGWYNTAVGANALSLLGAYNVAGGANNIAIGFNAGSAFTQNESSNIDIGNLGVVSENNITRIGAGQSDAYIAGTVHASLALTVGSGIITNGGAVWLYYPTNGLMGHTLTNLPWGTICTTSNGQFEVLSNMVWLLK